MPSRRELRLFHRELAVMAAGLLLAMLAAAWAHGQLRTAKDSHAATRARLLADNAESLRLAGAYDIWSRYRDRYAALRERGLIGAAHRPEWMEALEKEALRYRIAPRQPVAGAMPLAGQQLYATPMTLEFTATHEATFEATWARVKALPGYPVDQACELALAEPQPGHDYPELNVHCTLYWLHIAPAQEPVP